MTVDKETEEERQQREAIEEALGPKPDGRALALTKEHMQKFGEIESLTELDAYTDQIRQQLIDNPGMPLSDKNSLTSALALATHRKQVLSGQVPEDDALNFDPLSGAVQMGERQPATEEELAALPADEQRMVRDSHAFWERDKAAQNWGKEMLRKGYPVSMVGKAVDDHRNNGTVLPSQAELDQLVEAAGTSVNAHTAMGG